MPASSDKGKTFEIFCAYDDTVPIGMLCALSHFLFLILENSVEPPPTSIKTPSSSTPVQFAPVKPSLASCVSESKVIFSPVADSIFLIAALEFVQLRKTAVAKTSTFLQLKYSELFLWSLRTLIAFVMPDCENSPASTKFARPAIFLLFKSVLKSSCV